MVKTWGGSELGQSAQSVLDKVTAVIPNELKQHIEQSLLFSMRFSKREDIDISLDICRKAATNKRLLQLTYRRAAGECSQRRIRPLGLYFWGNVWTLVGWCELRSDFRHFRIDRMQGITLEKTTFTDEYGQTLADFIRKMRETGEGCR